MFIPFRHLNKTNIVTRKIRESKRKAMKIKPRHQDFSLSSRMLIIFFKLIGLATFNHCMVTKKNWSPMTLFMFKYSKLGIVYNVVLINLMIASNYLSIPFAIDTEYENKTNMTVAIEVTQSVLGTIVICTILLNHCINQKSLVQILNRLTTVEHELDLQYRLYPSLQRQRTVYVLTVICALEGCFMVVLTVSEYIAFQTSPISWLKDIVPTFHVGWCMIQYFVLMTIIQADFSDVNCAMQSLSSINALNFQPQIFCKTHHVIVSNSTIHQLLQLRDIHCHLSDISEEVSSFYSVVMLFSFAFMFVTLVYNAYYLISPFMLSDDMLETNVFVNTVIWLICVTYPIFFLTTRITKVINEMKETSDVVHSCLCCAIGSESKSELEHFSLQLLHRNIKFTANGYFTIDNDLFHSMIGATAIYLVILIQFQMGSDSSTVDCNCT